MQPYFAAPGVTLYHGDCLEVLKTLPDNSLDSCVCDPPYDLTANKGGGSGVASIDLDTPYGRARIGVGNGGGGFMGKAWDGTGIAFRPDLWAEVLRVLKPGGYLLAFGGTRTYHRMACAIEDAGFLIRDCLQWLYGSGFPKSLNVSAAIDKAAGVERTEVVGQGSAGYQVSISKARVEQGYRPNETRATTTFDITAPVTELAQEWDGWGTALKPANEPIVLAQKPLDGTYAANIAKWGVGALNIDGCRIASPGGLAKGGTPGGHKNPNYMSGDGDPHDSRAEEHPLGRWPANVILDEEAAAALDQQTGTLTSGTGAIRRTSGTGYRPNALGTESRPAGTPCIEYGDSGGASRFFYVAKAARSERDYGLAHLPAKTGGEATDREDGTAGLNSPRAGSGRNGGSRNTHPTVKPVALMRWLVRLVTPKGGTVLDPFLGSGTTGVACVEEGFSFIGIDREADYCEIAVARIKAAERPRPTLFDLAATVQ